MSQIAFITLTAFTFLAQDPSKWQVFVWKDDIQIQILESSAYYQTTDGGSLLGSAVVQLLVVSAWKPCLRAGFRTRAVAKQGLCVSALRCTTEILLGGFCCLFCVFFLMKEAEVFITFLFIFGYSSNIGL